MQYFHTSDELYARLKFPVPFNSGGKPNTSCTVRLYDDTANFGSSVSLDLKFLLVMPQDVAHVTFQELEDLLDADGKRNLQAFVKTFVTNQNLFVNTLHHVEVETNQTKTSRYFVLQALSSGLLGSIDLKVQDSSCRTSIAVPAGFPRATYGTVMHCTNSDVASQIVMNEALQARSFVFVTDVSNHEMTELISFVVGEDTSYRRSLLAVASLSEQTIYRPITRFTRGGSFAQDSTKTLPFSVTISCPVSDGINMVEMGHLFFERGIGISTDLANAKIKFYGAN